MSAEADMPGLRVYLINLDRSPDRLKAMAAQLDALGFAWTRVPAVDGRTLGDPPWPGYDRHAYEIYWGKTTHPGEVGCYLSHLKALETFLADGGDFGLILEDDSILGPEIREALKDVCEQADRWDVVKLAGYHSGVPATVADLRNGRRLVSFLQRQTGSSAYLVNPRAAKAYVAKLLPMQVPYDHAFDQVWRFGLRLRGVLPLPVTVGAEDSTIGYQEERKKRWYRRGAVLAYRSYTETRRVLHYLFNDTAWMGHLFHRKAGVLA